MKKTLLLILLSSVFFYTCEETDTTPPTVTITSPQNDLTVSEVVTITCISDDNDAVEKVELWVDGLSTGVTDNTRPYSMGWKTSDYEDGHSYIITIKSYDESGNVTESDPITLTVDNSGFYPSSVDLHPVVYEGGSFIITWSQNSNDDFSSYQLYESLTEDFIGSTMIFESDIITNTTYTVTDVTEGELRYYQVLVLDASDLESHSNTQAGNSYIQFVKTFGGSNEDIAYGVQQTSDGGYILTGFATGGGTGDLGLLKTDSRGNEEWNQAFGGDGYDVGKSVQQTTDGGFIIVGSTFSFGNGAADVFLIKTDAQGSEEWNQTLGADWYEYGYSIQETSDGGYIIAGSKHTGMNNDVWLIKTDSQGNEEWNKVFGDGQNQVGYSVQQTSDGGYIIVGDSWSVESNDDAWLIKTDSQGNEEWNKVFGGIGEDGGQSVQQTDDGGYIIGGYTSSQGAGEEDIWLIKTDSEGNEEWNRTFGDTQEDRGQSVQQTSDGGYVIFGHTQSNNSYRSVMLVKTNSDGLDERQKIHGESGSQGSYSGLQTSDGGYVIAGYKYSSEHNNSDFWLIKTDSQGSTLPESEWE